MTDRKSQKRFPLAPKSMTLDDLKRPLRTVEPTTKIWMKTDKTISDDDVAQWLDRFWQYKVFADIRGGSQDLRPYITYTGNGTPLSFSSSSVWF